jgi:GTPase
VERTRVLVHILDTSPLAGPDRDPLIDFDTLNAELARYAPDLATRPQVVALNKMDVTDVRDRWDELQNAFASRGIRLHGISAASGQGVKELLEEVWRVSQLAA